MMCETSLVNCEAAVATDRFTRPEILNPVVRALVSNWARDITFADAYLDAGRGAKTPRRPPPPSVKSARVADAP